MDAAITAHETERFENEASYGGAASRLRHRGARRWYLGAGIGLLYQVITIADIWSSPLELWRQLLASILLAVFYAGFLVLPPLFWGSSRTVRLSVVGAYWVYSLAFFPLIGDSSFWLWALVAAVAATLCDEFVVIAAIVVVLVGVPLLYGVLTGFTDASSTSAIVIFSVATMLYAMNRQIATIRQLRQAQSEIARLAVVEERARFSRDMHDVLGHSLTVVTVKSELARKLVRLDAERAEAEMADIERLSRAALADLRSAVAGYREMTLSTELGVAQAAIAAAGIEAHLPPSGDVAASDLRELFGWVLRESVTNVIRHSGAKGCWVSISRTEMVIEDDGRGFDDGARREQSRGGAALARGTGLAGLAERAGESGAVLEYGKSEHGGARIAVRSAAT